MQHPPLPPTGGNSIDPTSTSWSAPIGRQDISKRLCGPRMAQAYGAVTTLLVGLPLIWVGGQVATMFESLRWVVLAIWVGLGALQFWVAQSWHNGLTLRELLMVAVPPLDVIRSMKRGLQVMRNKAPGGSNHQTDDQGKKILNQTQAKMFGIALSALAGILLLIGIGEAVSAIAALVWLLVIFWVLGMITTFWVAELYQDGLTVNKLKRAALWPQEMFRTVRASVVVLVKSRK